MTRIASFDIFETLLVRTTLEPEAVLLDVGRELATRGLFPGSAAEFQRQRVQAEQRAMQFRGRNAATLAEIYVQLAHDWPRLATAPWFDIEIAIERQSLRAVPGAVERLRVARAASSRVIFLSDMYLPSGVLQSWLKEFGFWREGDGVYVSCELRSSKIEGSLFRAVAKVLNAEPSQFLHHGNDERGDVVQARRAGWAVVPWRDANHSQYERIAAASRLGRVGQRVFGAARLARLSVAASTPRLEAYRDLAAGVLLPTLTAYAFWILARAQADGIQRLYCLSRDGYLLARLLPRLAERLNLKIDVCYLQGSRQAWHLPGLDCVDEFAMEWICDACEGKTLAAILQRVGIDTGEIDPELHKHGFEDSTAILTGREKPAIAALLQEPAVTAKILEKATAARTRLHTYLRSCGFGDGVPAAMIDLGWFGRCRRSFLAATRDLGTQHHQWYYFGLLRSDENMAAYFYDFTRQLGLRRGNQFNGLLETLCLADHGTVRGYDDAGHPVCGPADPQAAWQLPVADAVINAFTDHLIVEADDALHEDLRPAVFAVLHDLYHHPSERDLTVWRDFDYSNEQSGLIRESFVQPYSWRELPAILRRGELISRSPAVWTGGSWLATPKSIRTAARVGLAIRSRLVRMIRPAQRSSTSTSEPL